MPGQKEISVGAKFTGDAKGFEKAAREVKGSATALKGEIKATTGIVDELSGAIGGTVGEVGNLISSFATAVTPIGALVALVGFLAKAWKTSQENIDLYLKSADKLAAGAAGFDLDAEKARVDTRKRANGMISEGYRIERENMAKLQDMLGIYTDEQKRHFALLVHEGQEMQKNGRALRDSVMGLSDKADWQIKYNGLLQEQERINDEGLVNREKWKGLDADLARNREIIANGEAKQADKAKAVIEAERIANQLLDEKNGFIDRQVENIRQISEMTATQEVVEGNIADLLTQKNENIKEYHTTMIKVDKMDTKATKELKSQADEAERKLRALKASAIEISRIAAPLSVKRKAEPVKFGGMARGGKDLAGPPIIETIGQLPTSLGIAQTAVANLENAFQNMFFNVGGGFRGMIRALMDSIKMLLAQLVAKAAIFGLLQLLFPAAGVTVRAFSGLKSFLGIPGFAAGTNFAPGGLSLVGEHGPELVSLPRGSKVSPIIGQNVKVEVVGKVKGRDLALILSRYQLELGTNT